MSFTDFIKEFNENEEREEREINEYMNNLRQVKGVQFKEKVLNETCKNKEEVEEEIATSKTSIGQTGFVVTGKVRDIMNILKGITEEEFDRMKKRIAA